MRISGLSRSVVVVAVLALLAWGEGTAFAADSWSVVASPSQSTGDTLSAVTCTGANSCWAVGGNPQPLIEQWNGSHWKTVSAPGATGDDSTLSGVACTSAASCWAVGATAASNLPLVEKWNGSSWSSTPAAEPPDGNGVFAAVTCVSSDDCWAVGEEEPGVGQLPLIESWNGTAWSVVPSPAPHHSGALSGIFCSSVTRCWAVGEDLVSTSTGETQPLIETWNGRAWTAKVLQLPSSSKTDIDNVFNDIACVSTESCWAVGDNTITSEAGPIGPDIIANSYTAIIEHWNGQKWSAAEGTGTANGVLSAVTCASKSNCTTVGSTQEFGVPAEPLIQTGPIGGWSEASAASPAGGGELDGLWCSATGCWAVGNTDGTIPTLIEREGTPS